MVDAVRRLPEYLPAFRVGAREQLPLPTFAGIAAKPLAADSATSHLMMDVIESAEVATEVVLSSSCAGISATDLARMLEHYVALLAAGVAEPDQPIGMLRPASAAPPPRRPTASRYAWRSLGHLVAEQASARPEAIACRSGSETTTYAELDARVRDASRLLEHRGIGDGMCVGISDRPSVDLVVGILAVLERRRGLRSDRRRPARRSSRARRVADRRAGPAAPPVEVETIDLATSYAADTERPGDRPQQATARPDEIALLVATAGVTGAPRYVPLTHRTFVEAAVWQRRRYRFGHGDRVLHAPGVGVLDVGAGAMGVPRRRRPGHRLGARRPGRGVWDVGRTDRLRHPGRAGVCLSRSRERVQQRAPARDRARAWGADAPGRCPACDRGGPRVRAGGGWGWRHGAARRRRDPRLDEHQR